MKSARKGEIEGGFVAFIDRDCKRRPHDSDIVVIQNRFLDAGEPPPGITSSIINRNSFAKGSNCILNLAAGSQIMAVGDPQLCTCGLFIEKLTVDRPRLIRFADLFQRVGEYRTHAGIAPFAGEVFEHRNSNGRAFLLIDNGSQLAPRVVIARTEFNCLEEKLLSLSESAKAVGGFAKQGQSLRMVTMAAQKADQELSSLFEFGVFDQFLCLRQLRIYGYGRAMIIHRA